MIIDYKYKGLSPTGRAIVNVVFPAAFVTQIGLPSNNVTWEIDADVSSKATFEIDLKRLLRKFRQETVAIRQARLAASSELVIDQSNSVDDA